MPIQGQIETVADASRINLTSGLKPLDTYDIYCVYI